MTAAFVDVDFHGRRGIIGTGVIQSAAGIWLVDPGPASALDGLRKSLDALGFSLADVQGLLLTHIHLDHAGASGTIVGEHPGVRVFVHERGAPHMIDPTRLLESARRLYAGSFERLWGEFASVPAARVEVLRGGERLDLDGVAVDVAYTPGHATHHVSYFLPEGGAAFLGDTGGARLTPRGYVVAPTPPPDIDLPAWFESIARLRTWKPSRLYLTHFGAVEEPDEHLAALDSHLRLFTGLVKETLDEAGEDGARVERFIARATSHLGRTMSAEDVERYQLAVPLDHCWLGLARYLRKQGLRQQS